MSDRSRTRSAVVAPRVANGTDASPNTSDSDQSMCPSHACTIVPGTASAAASASDVPSARRTGMCSTFMKSGASRNPPLLPSNPDTTAATATTATVRGRETGGDVVRLRFGRVARAPRVRAEQDAQSEHQEDHVGREHQRLARDPAGEERAERGQRHARRSRPMRSTPRSTWPARA